jgi:uncharacterized protein (DUF427 family)
MSIEFDKSDSEVLIVCHYCKGAWRAFAWTMDDAEQRAAWHEERAHPSVRLVRDRIATRHAKRRERAKLARIPEV